MKFQTFDEAEKSVKCINEELRFVAHFGELAFPAKAYMRCQAKRGTHVFSLSHYLGTAACAVPTATTVTYLSPKSQLGREALTIIGSMYPYMEPRKDGEPQKLSNGSAPLPKKRNKM